MSFRNAYEDAERAAAYARLAFPATYHLAYRDLPGLLRRHVTGTRALDFGCGAGRSTRFLREHGYAVTGVDISADMIAHARALDPVGSYVLIREDDLCEFDRAAYDLVTAIYPFDNIPGEQRRLRLMRALRALLAPTGTLLLLASAPELYVHEWASFTTRAYPENRTARSGERVRIVIRESGDNRPIDDLIWFDSDYRRLFEGAGLRVVDSHRPLGRADEGYAWVSETTMSPWAAYVTVPA
jgi:SAM-dependent methyltransferase